MKFIDSIGLKYFYDKLKDKFDDKDKYIVAAALQGRQIDGTVTEVSTEAGKAGDIIYNSTEEKYYYSTGKAWREITVDNLVQFTNNSNKLLSTPYTVPKNYWATSSPFIDNVGNLNGVYKGESVGGYTKWYLVLSYIGGTKYQAIDKATGVSLDTYIEGDTKYDTPWELWLPENTSIGQIIINS